MITKSITKQNWRISIIRSISFLYAQAQMQGKGTESAVFHIVMGTIFFSGEKFFSHPWVYKLNYNGGCKIGAFAPLDPGY